MAMKPSSRRGILLAAAALVLLLTAGFALLYLHGLSGLRPGGGAQPGQIRVACVGDSVTYGHGVSNWPVNHYPAVLGRLLDDGYHVRNLGVSGSTAQRSGDRPYAETAAYEEGLAYAPDILIFMLGSNDSKPENWQGAAAFREQYVQLLDSYLGGENPPVVYLCTPASAYHVDGASDGPTSFDIQPELVDEIAAIVRDLAEERGEALLDIHALTAAHPEWFAGDGVHPNADGAAAIAAAVFDALSVLS